MFSFPSWIAHTWFYLDGSQSKRILKRFFSIFSWIVAVSLLLFFALMWRLSLSPISLSFLNEDLHNLLDNSNLPVSIDFSNLVLALNAEDGFETGIYFKILDAEITRENKVTLASSSEIALNFSFYSLVMGAPQLTEVIIEEPSLYAIRNEDGSHDLGFLRNTRSKDASAEVPLQTKGEAGFQDMLFDALAKPVSEKPSLIQALQKIRINNGFLVVENRQTGNSWFAPTLDLDLNRTEAGVVGTALVRFVYQNKSSNVEANFTYVNDAETFEGNVNIDDIPPALLIEEFPVLQFLNHFESRFKGHAGLILTASEGLQEANLYLETEDAKLALPDILPDQVDISLFALQGSITNKGEEIKIDELTLETDDFLLSGKATARYSEQGINFSTLNEVTHFSASKIGKYWPQGVVTPARDWITENILSGDIPFAWISMTGNMSNDGVFTLGDLNGGIDVENGVIDYLQPMPKARGLFGHAAFTKEGFRIRVDKGFTESSTGKRASVKSGHVNILGLNNDSENIEINVQAVSEVGAALDIINSEPLSLLKESSLVPTQFNGQSSTNLTISFPLIRDLTPKDVKVSGSSKLEDVSIQNIFNELTPTQGTLDLSFTEKDISLVGDLNLLGETIKVRYNDSFQEKSLISTLKITSPLTVNVLNAFDLSSDAFAIGGRGKLNVDVTDNAVSKILKINADLQGMTVEVPALGWNKGADVKGTVSLTADFANQRVSQVDNFQVDLDDLFLKGSLSLIDNKIANVTLDQFKLGRSEGQAVIQSNSSVSNYEISVQAKALDLSKILSKNKKTETSDLPKNVHQGSDGEGSFNATIEVSRLYASEADKFLPNVTMSFIQDKGDVTKIKIASIENSQRLLDLIFDKKAGDSFKVASKNLGRVLNLLDYSDVIQGGDFSLTGTLKSGTLSGRATILNYDVTGSKLLSRVINASDNRSLKNVMTGNKINFNKFVADIIFKEDRLTIKNGRNSGGSLGLTLEGVLDLAKSQMDLQGTLIPVSGLNSALGNIPLIGMIVTGGEGQGVFALTYQAKGKLDDPKVSINPLSALAPGIFRSIFFLD